MIAQPLVRVAQDVCHAREAEGEASPDPAFGLSQARALNIDAGGWSMRALDHFAHLVHTSPADLRAHVQRINLCVTQANADAVYGALLDLFLVLGAKGAALRKRMHELAGPSLSREARKLFQDYLECGITQTDVLPAAAASVLSRGLRGTTRLVERVSAGAAVARDPLEEANECLEYGQVDAARCILEAAVLAEPERVELHNDLLEIYQRTKDRENFFHMHGKLNAGHNPLADSWELMAASFGDGDKP